MVAFFGEFAAVVFSHAAFEFKAADARLLTLGNLRYNSTVLSEISRRQISSSYTTLFNLSELAYQNISLDLPSGKLGGWQIFYAQFGHVNYREREVSLSHGFRLAKTISIGYSIKGLSLAIDKYGKETVVGVDCGFNANIHSRLNLTVLTYNVNSPTIGRVKQNLPQGVVTSVAYNIFENLLVILAMDKTLKYPLRISGGAEYKIFNRLFLRGGLQSNPSRFSAGLGLKFGDFIIDYGYFTHAELNGQHYLTLKYYL